MQQIWVWPDGDWCYDGESECFMRACGKSDDCAVADVPDEVNEGGYEAIDEWVGNSIKNGEIRV
jgi:hypothetical protein